jgi:hypothetical protein
MNEHVHPTILDQFDPTAMADRFKAATEPTESTPQLRAIKHLIEQAEAFKPIDMIGSEAKTSLMVTLEYIKRWSSKEYTDAELIQMIGIRLNNLATDLAKNEAQL